MTLGDKAMRHNQGDHHINASCCRNVGGARGSKETLPNLRTRLGRGGKYFQVARFC